MSNEAQKGRQQCAVFRGRGVGFPAYGQGITEPQEQGCRLDMHKYKSRAWRPRRRSRAASQPFDGAAPCDVRRGAEPRACVKVETGSRAGGRWRSRRRTGRRFSRGRGRSRGRGTVMERRRRRPGGGSCGRGRGGLGWRERGHRWVECAVVPGRNGCVRTRETLPGQFMREASVFVASPVLVIPSHQATRDEAGGSSVSWALLHLVYRRHGPESPQFLQFVVVEDTVGGCLRQRW